MARTYRDWGLMKVGDRFMLAVMLGESVSKQKTEVIDLSHEQAREMIKVLDLTEKEGQGGTHVHYQPRETESICPVRGGLNSISTDNNSY